MRKSAAVAFAACAALSVGMMPAYAAPADDASQQTGDYIVVLEQGADAPALAQQAVQGLGAEVTNVFRTAVNGYSATLTREAKDRLEADPNVAYVQEDKEVRAFAQPSPQAQVTPTGIDRSEADQSPTAAIDGNDDRVDVDVAVIDTGVDLDHPDLNVNQEGAKNCSLLGLTPDDMNGHGSHVAGTVGALDNGDGVVGMAPGARIWPVKVLNALGAGSTSDVICGIDYVAANADKIEVANMSLGGQGTDDGNCGRTNGDAQHEAICNAVGAGVTFVVAAGNDSADAANSTPAAYDEVITTSALADFNGQPGGGAAATCREDVDDTFADFSNFGPDIDLIAPGTCIDSTWMNGGRNTISGTSMASPHVAGAAALHKATNPGDTPAQVQSALQAAGTNDWIFPSEDPDGTQEPLLNVDGF
ncbi:S8 family serine peptidase [Allosaccharopolyspora coralli]|uniref:S8 family serine peptidase n=1 Tax=Allosaccharopolyspora coralli TaxID=2665642 RepID=A0A5Q3Q728_9PSEU|nr:S8 family serine peptidase [Allosaccharopolyspora coralli]QGK68964.1 S8 family serine peptidase [Allosaccharopolyspora coralli]